MLCDGRMVCGCGDPYAKRVLGDARQETVAGDLDRRARLGSAPRPQRRRIEVLRRLRAEAAAGEGRGASRSGRSRSAPLPSRLYIECTAACNISCAQACCAPETGITRTRQAGMLDFDLFTRVVDEAGPSLGRIDFFNYGEAFLHKRAVEMCEYIKSQLSAHLSLHEHQRPRLHRGLGATAGALRDRRSHVLDRRRDAGELRDVPEARRLRQGDPATCARRPTRNSAPARDVPFINWRYILFTHNDSDAEMQLARTMAADMGVDRLCWELTDHPEDMFSRRFVAGSAELEAHPSRDLGRQRSRKRDPGRDAAGRDQRARPDPRTAGRSAAPAVRSP